MQNKTEGPMVDALTKERLPKEERKAGLDIQV